MRQAHKHELAFAEPLNIEHIARPGYRQHNTFLTVGCSRHGGIVPLSACPVNVNVEFRMRLVLPHGECKIIRQAMMPLIRPAEQPAGADKTPSLKLTGSEMAFLKDVALVPDSGVVARYPRLGLSGRQGDKAKRSLIEMGLIEEIEKLTPKGRTKALRLTESG